MWLFLLLTLSCGPKRSSETGVGDGGSGDAGATDGGPGDGGPGDGGPGDGGSADAGAADSGAGDGSATDGGAGDGGAERTVGTRSLDDAVAIVGVEGSALGAAVTAGAVLADGGRQIVLGAPDAGLVEVYGEVEGQWLSRASLVGDGADQPGDAVAAWDFDGDTLLAVGAIHDGTGGSDAGAVHLLSTPLPADATALDDARDLLFVGVEASDYAGGSLAFGRFLGDDQPALAIGAGQADLGASMGGGVFIVGGLDGGEGDGGGQRSLADAEARLGWSRGAALMGTALATGDVDGDGLADLVVGGFGDDAFRGAAVLALAPLSGDLDLWTDADAILSGLQIYDLLGLSVAVLDGDGDGRGELAVGVPGDDSVDAERGGVLIFSEPRGVLDVGSASAHIDGAAAYDRAGWSLGSVGDVDGDGRDELLVGAPADDAGGAWLVYGPSSGRRGLDPTVDAAWVASGGAIAAGDVVAGVGDLLGSDAPELLVAAPDASTAWVVDAAQP